MLCRQHMLKHLQTRCLYNSQHQIHATAAIIHLNIRKTFVRTIAHTKHMHNTSVTMHTNLAAETCTGRRKVHLRNDACSISWNFRIGVPSSQEETKLFIVVDCFVTNLHHESRSFNQINSTDYNFSPRR